MGRPRETFSDTEKPRRRVGRRGCVGGKQAPEPRRSLTGVLLRLYQSAMTSHVGRSDHLPWPGRPDGGCRRGYARWTSPAVTKQWSVARGACVLLDDGREWRGGRWDHGCVSP